MYCAFRAFLRFNFEPQFDFIEFFKKYLKHALQKALKVPKKVHDFIYHLHNN